MIKPSTLFCGIFTFNGTCWKIQSETQTAGALNVLDSNDFYDKCEDCVTC